MTPQDNPRAAEIVVDMVLHCPACGLQHIDEADPDGETSVEISGRETRWDNPPHRSHLCLGCGHIWRPADVPTNGVAAVRTKGKADSPIATLVRSTDTPSGEEDHPLIERLLDAQQDINFAANTRMDQSLCDASALIDEIEPVLRRALATPSPVTAETERAVAVDVVRLVIAARIVAFEFDELFASDPMARAARDELDKASEAFASRVPWDDEPQAPKLSTDNSPSDEPPSYSGLCG